MGRSRRHKSKQLQQRETLFISHLNQANELKKQCKFLQSKNSFDKYLNAKDQFIRKDNLQCYQKTFTDHQEIDINIFKTLAELKIQDLIKYKSQLQHFQKDKYQYKQDEQFVALQPKKFKKLVISTVVHLQLELLNQKIAFYKTIGFEKEINDIAKSLVFVNKSSLFPKISEDIYRLINKANIFKKQGNIKKSMEILKKGINSFKDNFDKQEIYRKLANFSKQIDRDGNQIMTYFDKAILSSQFKKIQIARQRKLALIELSKIGSIDNHKLLLRYFDQLAKNSVNSKVTSIIVQKAIFLKSLGDVNQAVKTYAKAIQSVGKDDSGRKIQLIRQQAYFLADLGKNQQAIACMNQAESINPSNDYARFLRKLQLNPKLDNSTRSLIHSNVSNTSLNYPYGCDTKQYLYRAIKTRKAGNLNQAIQLLKKSISKTQDNHFKSEMYKYLAIFLKNVDKDGNQIMSAYDKAIVLSEFDKTKLTMQRRFALWELASIGSNETHKGLIKYFDELSKNVKKHKLSDFYIQRAYLFKIFGDSSQVIKAFSQAIQNLDKNEYMRRSQIMRQQAYFMKQVGKQQQAMKLFEQAQNIYKCKGNQKIRFLWSLQKYKDIQSIIESSKNPYQLKTIANLYSLQGDKLKQKSSDQNIIRQKYLQSVKIYDKIIIMLSDYSTIKKFLAQQALILKKAYGLSDIEGDVIEKHQDKLLSDMKIFQDYKFLAQKDIKHSNVVFEKRDVLENKLLEQSYFQTFTLKSMFQNYENKVTHYFIELMINDLVYKLWNQERYLQSYKIFEKSVFLKHQNLLISEQQCHAVLRKSFQAKKQYKANNFKQCLSILKSISSSPSSESMIKISICKNKDLQCQLQKLQAISMWNQGNYDAAAKIFSDMIFYSGKDATQFLNQKNKQAKNCQMILKYNAILYNLKLKNYTKCIRKMKNFQKCMGEGKQIKDSQFYINFANVYFEIAEKLHKGKNSDSIQNYCDFLDTFKKADQISTISKTHLMYKCLKCSIDVLKQTFFNNVRNMEEQVIIFRDLCFNEKTQTVVYNQVKDYIQKINDNLSNCFKIKEFGIISDIKKLDSLNTLKQCWDQTCYILYKQVINKGVSDNLQDVKRLADQLRAEMQQIRRSHGNSIDKDSLTKMPKIVSEIKDNFVDQFDSIMKSRTSQALNQIEEAYKEIKKYLQSNKCQNSTPDQIISKLVNDNLEMKQQNQFFMDLLDDLQNQVDLKKSQSQSKNQNGENLFNPDQLLVMINSAKGDIQKNIEQRISKKMQQINQAHEILKNSIESILQKGSLTNSGNIDNGQVLKQLVSGHHKMKDQNQFFKDMLDQAMDQTDNLSQKIIQLQKLIEGLQSLTKSSISVHQIESMLRQLAEKHLYSKITQESRQVVKKLISNIEQDKTKQNQLEKRIFQYVDKNITKLLDYISNILEPINDGNVQKYFKRFKDDLLLRDNKIKDLQALLRGLQLNQSNSKLSKDVEDQIKKLQDQVKLSKAKLQSVSSQLRKIFDTFPEKADLDDLRKLKQQLMSSYLQSDDISKKLQLLSNDTLVGNYHDLLEHLEYLKNYIAVNDKKINILGNKLGTKIVTTFNNILRNDQVKFDKHGKLKYQPQRNQIRMNVNSQSQPKQNNDPHSKRNPSKLKKSGRDTQNKSLNKLFRTHPVYEKYKVTQVSRVIDKGRHNVDMQGQVNRKVNVVIMQNSRVFES